MGKKGTAAKSGGATPTQRVMSTWRSFLMKEWEREVSIIIAVQKIRNPVFDIFFYVASLLGDEVFYISFLPFCVWMWGFQTSLHMSLLMSLNISIGNICKNVLSLPRPPTPPIWLNSSPQLDHGMPSTHTMSAVSVPFYFIYYFYEHPTTDHYYLTFTTAVVLGIFWAASVAFSRIYNGHHSPMDVASGAILASTILYFFIHYFRHLLDYSVLSSSPIVPALWFFAGAFVLYIHHIPAFPTPAYGESGLVLGTGVGVVTGMWLYQQMGFPQTLFESYNEAPPAIVVLLRSTGLIWLVRFIIGASVVLLVRMVAKKLFMFIITKHVFPRLKPTASHIREVKPLSHLHPHPRSAHLDHFKYETAYTHHYAEVMVKYMTYFNISLAATCYVPLIFVALKLSASVDYPYTPVPPYALW
eukprot:TRINITY_DN9703_c0_g1_i3.p1 TRINITY_DN9703_c0_g1~~TRINITY_DN9703_c0_g1_i3.p1  ORF type:complete len:437 (+),score=86.22 TRINITY_DN9703_c0_g1_i3:71-1312(+)